MLADLINEIEEKLRLIVREEIQKALLESKNPSIACEHIWSAKKKEFSSTSFPSILTAKDVAEILGINVQRVYELVRARKTSGLPVIILGERQYRFSKDAILEWIKTNDS